MALSGRPSLRRRLPLFHFQPVSAKQNPCNVFWEACKNLLRARGTVNEYSTIAPVLASGDVLRLSSSQAVGMVASAQANFFRVIVQSLPPRVSRRISMDVLGASPSAAGEKGAGFGVELLCEVKALLRKLKRTVWVGDRVLIGSIDWAGRRGIIENVFDRRSEIPDPPVANADRLLVVFSLEQPTLEAFGLTRFLVEAESIGLPLTLSLNKSELANEETLITWKSRLLGWGYDPVFCSVETKQGLDTLASILREQTTVIVGPSGVGKSSLINVLRKNTCLYDDSSSYCGHGLSHILGSNLLEDQRVGEVAKKGGKGKHTTRNVSLLPLPEGGYLADTPGFNRPALFKVAKHSLAGNFPEIRKMLNASEIAKCMFRDCLHLGEPGCIINADWDRYQYYVKLLEEIKIREDSLRVRGSKRESHVRHRVGEMGLKEAKPKLDPRGRQRQCRQDLKQSLSKELDRTDNFGDM